jgi:hypothetical protein
MFAVGVTGEFRRRYFEDNPADRLPELSNWRAVEENASAGRELVDQKAVFRTCSLIFFAIIPKISKIVLLTRTDNFIKKRTSNTYRYYDELILKYFIISA